MTFTRPGPAVRDGTPANLSVAFLLLPDFTLSTFAGFVDALRIAADEADGSRQLHCRWTILGADHSPVRSSCGVEIAPWESIERSDHFDYTIVVGGLLRGHARIDNRILSYLRQVDERGGWLVGICTGSFALARAGLMRHHRCCVHWFHLQEFMEQFPDHRVTADSLYTVDGRRITCAGGQGAIDLAVHLVERHCGRDMALKVTSGMVVSATRGPKDPQPHPELQWFREIDSGLVQRAILIMEQHLLAQPVVVQLVSTTLGVSARTLVRAFKKCFNLSPSAFFRAMRVAHSRWELLNTNKSSGRIALDHGFSDASHFTRVFRKYYGATPAAARDAPGRGTSTAHRGPARVRRRMKTALDKILWGNTQSMSFAEIDWQSNQELPTVLGMRSHKRPANKRPARGGGSYT
jgi:transcriptional regulator GlxA family with amidase domain